MQTSGTFPQLSDGVKKQMTGTVKAAPKVKPAPVAPAKPASGHRRGGFAKHAKGRR